MYTISLTCGRVRGWGRLAGSKSRAAGSSTEDINPASSPDARSENSSEYSTREVIIAFPAKEVTICRYKTTARDIVECIRHFNFLRTSTTSLLQPASNAMAITMAGILASALPHHHSTPQASPPAPPTALPATKKRRVDKPSKKKKKTKPKGQSVVGATHVNLIPVCDEEGMVEVGNGTDVVGMEDINLLGEDGRPSKDRESPHAFSLFIQSSNYSLKLQRPIVRESCTLTCAPNNSLPQVKNESCGPTKVEIEIGLR
jgi:hypothetical protein